ncbi:MAG: hypothetical protein Q9199_002884 [Rusavskia elegans]
MSASATPTLSSSQVKKYKAACDHCHRSKTKCSGGGPPCKRCADTFHPCHYSPAARIGKPKGSKNKKTLERFHRNVDKNGGSDNGDGFARLLQPRTVHGRPAPAQDRAPNQTNELREDNKNQNPYSISDFGLLSPSIDAFLDSLNPSPSAAADRLNGADGDEPVIVQSMNLDMPDFAELGGANEEPSWGDALANGWNPLSSTSEQQLVPGATDAGSPPSMHSYSSVLDGASPISLDAVAAQLEDSHASTIVSFGQSPGSQSLPCSCLRKYTDVLCQLQTIEKRQLPVETDTLLTCTNLVISMTERQTKCAECHHDARVLMQLVMVYQTILTWVQGLYESNSSCQDQHMTLGRHELTKEERRYIRVALVVRVLKCNTATLRSITSRTSNAALTRRGEDSWSQGATELHNVQRIVNSLIQRYDVQMRRLASGKEDQKNRSSTGFQCL